MSVQQLFQQTKNYRSAIQDFLSVVEVIGSDIEFYSYGDMNSSLKQCVVMYSCMNDGIVFHNKFVDREDMYDVDVFCVWNSAIEHALSFGYSIVWIVDDQDVVSSWLDSMYLFVGDAIDRWLYNSITLCSMVSWQHIPMYPLSYDAVQLFSSSVWLSDLFSRSSVFSGSNISISSESVDIKNELIEQMMQYMMYGMLLCQRSEVCYIGALMSGEVSSDTHMLLSSFGNLYARQRMFQWIAMNYQLSN